MLKTCNKCVYGLRGVENLIPCWDCCNHSEFYKNNTFHNLIYKLRKLKRHYKNYRRLHNVKRK